MSFKLKQLKCLFRFTVLDIISIKVCSIWWIWRWRSAAFNITNSHMNESHLIISNHFQERRSWYQILFAILSSKKGVYCSNLRLDEYFNLIREKWKTSFILNPIKNHWSEFLCRTSVAIEILNKFLWLQILILSILGMDKSFYSFVMSVIRNYIDDYMLKVCYLFQCKRFV